MENHGPTTHKIKWREDDYAPIAELPMEEVVRRIEILNKQLENYGSMSGGWAPVTAAELLGKSRLDWQTSLSGSLRRWISGPDETLTSGDLILAWANLGSLIEGTIKLILSVYYEQYKTDIDALKKAGAYLYKQKKPKCPDGLTLEPLRRFCAEKKIMDTDDLDLVKRVQERRNAIHAFKHRTIGDDAEFQQALRGYLQMMRNIIGRLPPYQDGYALPSEWVPIDQ